MVAVRCCLVVFLFSCLAVPGAAEPARRPAPFCGLVLWASNPDAATYADAITLEFSYFYYSDVARDNGRGAYSYDWSVVDSFLRAAAARGHHGIVRFRDTDPGLPPGRKSLPESLWVRTRTASYDEGIEGAAPRTVVFPDWSDSRLGDFLVEFYRHLAARYPDPSTGLAYVEVGFGLWGEYHIDFDNLSDFSDPASASRAGALGTLFPSRADQVRILSAVDAAFATMPWGISIDAADSDFGPFSSAASASGLGFGLFDDSLLHEDWAESNRENWAFFGPARKRMMNGGEFSYYTDHDQRHALSAQGPHGTSLAAIARRCGLSFVIADGQTRWHRPETLARAGVVLGYALRVVEQDYARGVLRVRVRNTGVAPVTHPVRATAEGRESSLDLFGLEPGQERVLELRGLKGASPVLGFTSPWLLAGQVIPWTGP